MLTDICSVENISYAYQKHLALQGVTFSLPKGSFSAIAGPNGGGKSTLLKLIAGDLRPQSGTIRLRQTLRADLGYLPQRINLQEHFPLKVGDVVGMGLWAHMGSFARLRARVREKISQALDQVGLSGFESRPLSCLSGGQFQRILFARLWAQNASFIVLDEPFTFLDEPTTHELMQLLLNWHKQGKTILIVLHDLSLIQRYIPQTLLLSQTLITFGPTKTTLSQKNLQKAALACAGYPQEIGHG